MSKPSVTDSPSTTARWRVLRFFLLTLGITWSLQLPSVLMKEGILEGNEQVFMPFVVLGVFGPLVAAWLLVRRTPGGSRALFQSLYTRRPGVGWMFFALILPGALLSLGLLGSWLWTGPGPLAYPIPPERIAAALLIALGEEVGWRGFALPRLSKDLGRLKASTVIGVVWTVWHIPMFVGQEFPLRLMPLMLLMLTAGSIVFSWFYFKTGGSLLIAVLLHVGTHLNNSHLALPEDTTPLEIHTAMWVLLAALLVFFDRKFWSRKPGSSGLRA